jgi:hypothetical protein
MGEMRNTHRIFSEILNERRPRGTLGVEGMNRKEVAWKNVDWDSFGSKY